LKIITLTIQTDVGEISNTRQEEHALNSDHGQELNRFDTNSGLWKREELGVVHVTHTQSLEGNVGLCATPCFQGVTLYYISEDQLTLNWKRGALRHIYIYIAIVSAALILFSSTFLMK